MYMVPIGSRQKDGRLNEGRLVLQNAPKSTPAPRMIRLGAGASFRLPIGLAQSGALH